MKTYSVKEQNEMKRHILDMENDVLEKSKLLINFIPGLIEHLELSDPKLYKKQQKVFKEVSESATSISMGLELILLKRKRLKE